MWFKVRGSLRDQLGVRKGVEKASKNEPLLTKGETFFLQIVSIIKLFFLRKVIRQSHTDITPFRMQFEKEGVTGLLWEPFQGNSECLVW